MQRIRLRPLVENGSGGFKKCVKIIMEEIVAYEVIVLYSWSGKEKTDKSKFIYYFNYLPNSN